MEKLSTQPYKGTRDFYPEEMKLRNWFFGKIRETLELCAFDEYNGPMLESLELYAAKSGDELAREQTDPSTGICQSVFYVEYNIYRNEGNFRTDMSYDTAPLAVTIEESDGVVLITDVRYRYN